MVQKILAYQSLLNAGLYSNENLSSSKRNGLLAFLFWLMVGLGQIWFMFLGINSLFMYFIGIILVLLTFYGERGRSELFRSLPVSDRFVIIHVVFFIPMGILFLTALFFGIIGALQLYNGLGSKGMNFYLQGVEPVVFLDIVFLCCGIVFLCGVGAMHRNGMIKGIWYLCIVFLCVGFLFFTVQKIAEAGYNGQVDIPALIGFYPKIPMLIGSVCFIVASGIFSYYYGLYMYRHDLHGQRSAKTKGLDGKDNLALAARLYQMTPEERKGITGKGIGLAILCMVAYVIFLITTLGSSFGLFEDGTEVALEYSQIEDYDKWNTMEDEIGLGEDLRDLNHSNVIFPKAFEHQEAEYYCAGISGSFDSDENGDWTDLSYYRVLVMNLSKESYEEEKNRVASVIYTYGGEEKVERKVNRVLKDTKHFSGEAYIACFDTHTDCYEYAIFDDDLCKVIYLYSNDAKYLIEKTADYEIVPKAFSPVITLKNSNTENMGYSIYNFYNVEVEYYEEW